MTYVAMQKKLGVSRFEHGLAVRFGFDYDLCRGRKMALVKIYN